MTDPAAGKKGITVSGAGTATPGYWVVRVEAKSRPARFRHRQLAFDDMVIPDANPARCRGRGLSHRPRHPEGGRIGIAAQAIGSRRGAFEAARDYARERVTFGRPIAEHQAVAFRLASMATEIEAARCLDAACRRAARGG